MQENTSDFIKKLFRLKFIAKLQVAKHINLVENFRRHITWSCILPQGDKLSLVHSHYFVLIPIEKRIELFKSIEKIKKKYKPNIFAFRDYRKIEKDFDKFSSFHHSWYDMGFIIIKDSKFKSFGLINFHIIRVSESFFILSLNVNSSESYKYDFYNLFHTLYKEKMILKFPKLKMIFKAWPSTTNPPSIRFKSDLNDLMNRQSNEVYNFLKINNIDFHKGINNYISSLFTFSFKKDVFKNNFQKNKTSSKKTINEFWEYFGFSENHINSFSDIEKKFHFYHNHEFNSKLLLVDESLITYDKSFSNIENYLRIITQDWLTTLSPIYVIDNYFDYLYSEIDIIRNKFLSLIKNKRKNKRKNINDLMSVTNRIELLFYDFYRIKEEYFIDKVFNYNRSNFPNFHYKYKNNNNLYYDIIYQKLKQKKDTLERLINYSLQSIDRYNTLSFNFNNIKIQNTIYLLTSITVLIGVIQIFGKDKIIEYYHYLIKLFL